MKWPTPPTACRICNLQEGCESFNFTYSRDQICELNNATKEMHDDDYKPEKYFVYYEKAGRLFFRNRRDLVQGLGCLCYSKRDKISRSSHALFTPGLACFTSSRLCISSSRLLSTSTPSRLLSFAVFHSLTVG